MPPLPSAATGVRMSRRAALTAAAALAGATVVGCTPEKRQGRREVSPAPVEPEIDPDVVIAAEALAEQRQVLELLVATRERHPRLAARLAPVVAAHEAQAALLADAVPADVPTAPTTSSPAPGEPGAGAGRARVPRNRARALARVLRAERDLVTTTKQHAFRAESGGFARLLGSMAAAAAQHEAVLAATPARPGSSS